MVEAVKDATIMVEAVAVLVAEETLEDSEVEIEALLHDLEVEVLDQEAEEIEVQLQNVKVVSRLTNQQEMVVSEVIEVQRLQEENLVLLKEKAALLDDLKVVLTNQQVDLLTMLKLEDLEEVKIYK